MSTERTEPEKNSSPEAQALDNFVKEYLLPKALALIRDGRDIDFFDQLGRGGVPELVPPLVELLSVADDPEVRTAAGYHAERAAIAGGGATLYTNVMNRLLSDSEREVAELVNLYLSSTAHHSSSKHPDLIEAARELEREHRSRQA